MAFDIYGNGLIPGYCEVHPQVNEEYPCLLCRMDEYKHPMNKQKELEIQKEYEESLVPDKPFGVVEQIGQEIYQSMKGFRVKNTHAKKCAINAVNLVLKSASSDAIKNYYGKVLVYLENLKV